MDWLNYHHLLYFSVVAREGSLVAAGNKLHLSHSTLSAQIRALEERLGQQLFTRSGRRLELTETGRLVYRYADEIFSLGREMLDTVRGRASGRPLRLDVGVVDVVPKLIVKKLLDPVFAIPEPVHLVCHEGSFERLLGDLALHVVDVVLSDSPVPSGASVRAYHHQLSESTVSLFAVPELAARYRKGFPRSLDGAPLLLPIENVAIRRSLDQWFESVGVRPNVVAEFQDSAQAKVFGAEGLGIFPAPRILEADVKKQFGVERVGRIDAVSEQFFAVSLKRRVEHPAVAALTHRRPATTAVTSGRRREG